MAYGYIITLLLSLNILKQNDLVLNFGLIIFIILFMIHFSNFLIYVMIFSTHHL